MPPLSRLFAYFMPKCYNNGKYQHPLMAPETRSAETLMTELEEKTRDPNAVNGKEQAQEIAQSVASLREQLKKEKAEVKAKIRERFAKLKESIDYSRQANGIDTSVDPELQAANSALETEMATTDVELGNPVAEGEETTGEAQPEAKKESSIFGEIGTELTKEFTSASAKMSKAKSGSEKFTIVMETIGTMSVKLMEAFGKFMEFMKDKLGSMGAGALKSMSSLGKFLPLPGFAKDLLNSVSNSERALLIDALKSTGKFTLVPDTSLTGKNADARALTALQAKFAEYKKLKEPVAAPAPAPATPPAAPAGAPATPATTPAPTAPTAPATPKVVITFEQYMSEVVMPEVTKEEWKDAKRDQNGMITLTLAEVVSAL